MTQTSTSPRTELTLPLRSVARADIHRVGSKAANLGELSRAGFPVPDGFVLTTEAFGRFLDANPSSRDRGGETARAASLPVDLAQAIRSALASLDGAPLAVRSSGVDEDLAGASYAGQYETVLGVRGPEEVLAAVQKCWASAFSKRVAAYRQNQHQDGMPRMAVLVQRLVKADAAGVAFTANPVTQDRSETIVSAVKGLGERLVSGEASPDEWTVKGREATSRSRPEEAIEAEEVVEVAEMARKIEEHFGTPQDVEWAIEKGKLHLLQARPITTLSASAPAAVPIPIEAPPGFWERDAAHYPEPLCPMFSSVVLEVMGAAAAQPYRAASIPVDGVEFREIGGWQYSRTIPAGGKERPAPPPWLVPILIRVVPPMRRSIKGMVEAVRSDLVGSFAERWHSEWKPGQIARIAELQSVELPALSDEDLARHFDTTLDFVAESLRVHGLVTALDVMVADMVLTCRELLGWEDRRALELLSGLSEKTSEPGRRLSELARMARERPVVRALLDRVDDETAARLASVDPEYAAALDAYLREFGMRPLRFEVLEPTLLEQPALALRLIRDQIARDYDPKAEAAELARRRAETLAEARVDLAAHPLEARERFERALARAERAHPIREDHEFYLTGVPFGLLRYTALEIGRRLAKRGQIAERDDVLFLRADEARAGLLNGGEYREAAALRKGERAWALAHPGPASYGNNPGPPLSISAFPPEAKRLLESVFWVVQGFSGPQSTREQPGGTATIRGIAASSGRYTGPVRVIMTESEFGKLQSGDVLVCPTTSPVWSVLFPSVGALVTDAGGILSHPALIAREYGIPAVVATCNATGLLKDGQVVTVDGMTGTVEVQP